MQSKWFFVFKDATDKGMPLGLYPFQYLDHHIFHRAMIALAESSRYAVGNGYANAQGLVSQ